MSRLTICERCKRKWLVNSEICNCSHPLLEQDEIDIGLPSNSSGWITDRARLEDKCRTLEKRLSEATALLERAKPYVVSANSEFLDAMKWLADLERFTKGLE